MLHADDLNDTMHALVADIETDTRMTPDERAFMVVYHAALNAGDTTRQQDNYFLNFIMRKFVCQNTNY